MHQFKIKEHDCVYIWGLHLIQRDTQWWAKAKAEWGVNSTRVCRGEISARGGGGQHCGIKRSDFCLHLAWWWSKWEQISAAVCGQVAVGRLLAIQFMARWRAFLSCSHTYRSNSDKWDVTALVKQGYNLSKYNIICDLTWQPRCLFLTSQLAWIHLQNITFSFFPSILFHILL